MSSGKLGYRASLRWLVLNDDTEFLDDECGAPSVTLCLVADIFGVDTEKATADLRFARNRIKRESE